MSGYRCYRCKKRVSMVLSNKKKGIYAKLCESCFKIVLKNVGKELTNYNKPNEYLWECVNCGQQLTNKSEAIKHRKYFCDSR